MKKIITMILVLMFTSSLFAVEPTAPGERVGVEKCTATRATDNREPEATEEVPAERPADTATIEVDV